MALVSWTTAVLLLSVPANGSELPAGVERLPLNAGPGQISNGLSVRAVINGRPARLLVDTGASLSGLDRRFADELKLVAHAHAEAVGIGAAHVPMPLARLSELRIGSVVLQPHVGILDLGWLNTYRDPHDGLDVVGLLGADVLQVTGARVDFDPPALYFRDPVERDRQRFQGAWRAVSLVRRGEPANPAGLSLRVTGRRAVLATGRSDGVRVLAGTLDFYRDAFTPRTYCLSGIEHLDPPKRSRQLNLPKLDIYITERGMAVDWSGCFEFAGDRLVLTLPTDLRQAQRQTSRRLESTAANQTDVVTFERDRSPTDFRVHLALLVRRWIAGHTGWELAVGGDGALMGSHRGRNLQIEARPDGSLTARPLRR